MTDDRECVHEWGRLLSDPGTPRCVCCLVPYNPDVHNPPLPEWATIACDKCGADNWRRYTWKNGERYGYYCIRCNWDTTDENEAVLEQRRIAQDARDATPADDPIADARRECFPDGPIVEPDRAA